MVQAQVTNEKGKQHEQMSVPETAAASPKLAKEDKGKGLARTPELATEAEIVVPGIGW